MMRCATRDRQYGAALVLFIGVVAALAVLSAALVFAVSNARVNTSRDQQNTLAFNAAEAALDVTMEELASSWPQGEQVAYLDWTESDKPTFAAEVLGAATPAPRPDGLPHVHVRVFDDPSDPASEADPGWEWDMPNWDANHNGTIFVDAQARIRGRAVRIRGAVLADYYHLPLPKAVAIWADHTLSSTGSGTDADVTAEVLYDTQAAVHAGEFGDGTDTLWDPALFYPDSSDGAPPLSQDHVEELVQIARDSGRYFSGVNAETQMKTELQDAASGPWEGLIVLDFRESGASSPVSIDPGSYNCVVTNSGDATVVSAYLDPGALLILGNDLRLAGNVDYYGLVYVEGNVAGEDSHAAGKPVIHGMLYCVECPSTGQGGYIDLKGHASVRFNANAARYLGSQFVTSVQLLDNGWRELSPTVSPSP